LNIDSKISLLPIWCYIRNPCAHLRNFNKQHLILAKFYINNASSSGNQTAKFHLNIYANSSYSGFCEAASKHKCPVVGNRLLNPEVSIACWKIPRQTF